MAKKTNDHRNDSKYHSAKGIVSGSKNISSASGSKVNAQRTVTVSKTTGKVDLRYSPHPPKRGKVSTNE